MTDDLTYSANYFEKTLQQRGSDLEELANLRAEIKYLKKRLPEAERRFHEVQKLLFEGLDDETEDEARIVERGVQEGLFKHSSKNHLHHR